MWWDFQDICCLWDTASVRLTTLACSSEKHITHGVQWQVTQKSNSQSSLPAASRVLTSTSQTNAFTFHNTHTGFHPTSSLDTINFTNTETHSLQVLDWCPCLASSVSDQSQGGSPKSNCVRKTLHGETAQLHGAYWPPLWPPQTCNFKFGHCFPIYFSSPPPLHPPAPNTVMNQNQLWNTV